MAEAAREIEFFRAKVATSRGGEPYVEQGLGSPASSLDPVAPAKREAKDEHAKGQCPPRWIASTARDYWRTLSLARPTTGRWSEQAPVQSPGMFKVSPT